MLTISAGAFVDEGYAREELVAELEVAFLRRLAIASEALTPKAADFAYGQTMSDTPTQ